MARRPRLCVPLLPHLVLQRADGQAFAGDDDFRNYLRRLAGLAPRHRVQVHGYCLLPQAVWLLLTPQDAAGMSALMQALARLHSRAQPSSASGPAWHGRFRSAVLQPTGWALTALAAVDLAPELDAGLPDAAAWPWSSLAHHVGRVSQPWLRELPALWALGNTPYAREAEFARLLQAGAARADWPQLVAALRGALALGDPSFIAGLQQQLGRPLQPGRRGRPRRAMADAVAAGKI